jgi:hypothetical protein
MLLIYTNLGGYMKLIMLSLLMSFSAFATTTADVQCSINQPIVLDTTWNRVMFRQADVNFWNLTSEGEVSNIEITDRFGPAYEVIFRVWADNNRCASNNLCISTDFSSMRGLSFSFPKEVFTTQYHNFSMRVRLNSTNRSVFANCRSNLR